LFQSYNMDQANLTGAVLTCASLPVPVVSSPGGSGPFTATLSWRGVSSADDCDFNSSIDLGSDCSGAGTSRPLHTGWKVYSKDAPCTLGPVTSHKSAWHPEGGALAA